MGRWKAVIGPKLNVRHFDNQKTETKTGVSVLKPMTELGRPKLHGKCSGEGCLAQSLIHATVLT
ncbi:hypothetical protein JOH51_007404 [Rhizobium leguminosarum]|nr:hypothetical protein [Rhizobium leguminosarum]